MKKVIPTPRRISILKVNGTIKHVFGIYPSNSGNIRVCVTFRERGDLHFYMNKNGALHIPNQHNEETLDDSFEAHKEFLWVETTWKKTNPEVVMGILTGELREKAVALCLRMMSPDTHRQEVMAAIAVKAGTAKLSGKNKEILDQVKKNLKSSAKADSKKPVEKTQTSSVTSSIAESVDVAPKEDISSQEPVVEKIESKPIKSVDGKDLNTYGTDPIDKFKNKYARAGKGRF